jgi:hypothetical protein
MTLEKKDQDDSKKEGDKKDDKDQKDQIDPKLAELMKDPDAVQALLAAKRAANDEAKQYRLKLEAIEQKKKEADEAALKEQGKFKELAETAQREKAEAEARFKTKLVELALMTEAVKLGIVDADGVKLADASQVKVDNNWNVQGAKEAIEALKAAKSYLFEKKEGAPLPPAQKPGLRGQGKEEKLTPHERMMRSEIK